MSSDHHDAPSTAPPSSTPEWVDEYNSVLAKREYKAPVIPGPHCCSICCTFFSSIGALFLFLISGLLKSHYPYVHIEGDLQAMASSTGYAGLLYMLIAMVSMCYWVQGMTKRKEWEDQEQEEASLLGGGGKSGAEADLAE